MKKLAVLAAVPVLVCLGAAPAFAGNAGDGSGYGTQPGYDVANSHTICAGHGAFGYFGKDFSMAGGANGQLTGYYNSALCGQGKAR